MFGKSIGEIMGKKEGEKRPSAAELLEEAQKEFGVNLSDAGATYKAGMKLGMASKWEEVDKLRTLLVNYLTESRKEEKTKTKEVTKKEPVETEVPVETEFV